MTAVRHQLTLRLDIKGAPVTSSATKIISNIHEVVGYVASFIQEFGDPDEGPQVITIEIKSEWLQ